MKSITKLLPALGLVFGATLAMAMNVPTMVPEKDEPRYWTPDEDEDSGYREVTEEIQTMPYQCNSGGPECLVQFDNDNPETGVKSIYQPGVFNPL
ncbi:DUF6520 family protein [Algoriphagus resistens]|uniref:DUF6520 family protein n=1 Tax=Algoriphagus resistens TaxID=1750590 RepID=UPI0007169FB1|nr:DUF6520 family protein [Algoriphagus resistens]